MTPEQLKASVLQYAMQGKLVEQRIEDGNADALYEKLLDAKERLVNEKLILKKASTAPFYEAEYPFGIPETWKWVQLSDVSIIQEGAGIRKFQYRDSGTQILCVTNILDGSIDLEKKKLYIDTEEYKEKYIHLTLNKGDIVTSCSGGSWGKISFFFEDETLMLNTSTLRMRFFDDLADNEYLYYVCQSSLFKNQLTEQLSGMQPNFGYAHYSRICFPLPPLEEQHRIVAKIEELLPFADRYAEAYEKLEKFNAKFPEDMKKSILQYAIMGKLVEQRPEEGSAEELYKRIQDEKQKLIAEKKIKKEKPLAEITEDEIPFDIPDNWKWVRVGNMGSWASGATPSRTNPQFYGGNIPWLKTGDLNDGFIEEVPEYITELALEKTSVRLNPEGSVLMAMYGATIGKLGILNRPMTTNQACCACITFSGIYNKYLFYFLMSQRPSYIGMAEGGAQPNISKEKIIASVMPLPPLEEQKRIVAKIEELLPYCNQLIKN